MMQPTKDKFKLNAIGRTTTFFNINTFFGTEIGFDARTSTQRQISHWISLAIRGVKMGRPGPFWPDPFLARFIWTGPGWPNMVKRVAFLDPAHGLAGWRAGPLAFSHMF